MKILRNTLLIPGMIFTILCILHELSLLFPELKELNLFWTCFRWCGAGLVFTLVYVVLAVQQRWETKRVLRVQLLMKIMALPVHAVCIYLLYGNICHFIEHMDNPITSFLFMWIGTLGVFFSYGIALTIQSGMIGIAGAINGKREGVFSKKAVICYGIVLFLPIVDLIVTIVMLRKVKQL